MEEEELEFVEELEAVLQLTPDVQLAIEQVSVPPPEGRGGECGGRGAPGVGPGWLREGALFGQRWELSAEGKGKVRGEVVVERGF